MIEDELLLKLVPFQPHGVKLQEIIYIMYTFNKKFSQLLTKQLIVNIIIFITHLSFLSTS